MRYPFHDRKRGMALVVILSLLVLITVVVMAFFVHATSNRVVEASRSNQTLASLLGKTASDYVIGTFFEEIALPANNTADSSNGMYFPAAAANSVPEKIVATSIAAEPEFLLLVRQSIAAADPNASDHNSGSPAKNGRTVDAKRWNMPQLIPGAGFNDKAQLPSWIYVDKEGPKKVLSSNMIGRFAFNAYEVGGLLNANAAGHPTGSTPALLKGYPAGAVLNQLGVPATAVSDLLAFRHQSEGVYRDIVLASARSGFLTVTPKNLDGSIAFTNNYFTGRQDLLRYAQTTNTDLAAALPYLTHFSRAVNAPSWRVTAATSTNVGLPTIRVPAATSTLTHYRDDGSAIARDVTPGSALLQTRFSLARLAWLTHTGEASGISGEAIQACFGLAWDNANARWNYVGASGSTVQSTIKTLATVASENREPDFFELLKAAILSGSLGLSPGTYAAGAVDSYYSGQKDAQIIQIGVNIIDQYDSNSYPTAIYFPALPAGSAASVPPIVFNTYFGIENLPYLSRLYSIAMNTGAMGAWLQPQLWNPHQAPPAGSISASPTQFRVKTYGNNNMRWKQAGNTEVTSPVLNYTTTEQTKGLLYFGTSITDFRSNPQVLIKSLLTTNEINSTDAKTMWQTGHPWGGNQFVGIFAGETTAVPKLYTADNNDKHRINTYSIDAYNSARPPDITVTLEYNDGTKWLPYNVMARLQRIDPNETKDIRGWDVGVTFLGRMDPRTDRFSVSMKFSNSVALQNTSFQPNATTRYPVSKLQPSSAGFTPVGSPTAGDIFIGDWAKNTATSSARYTDPDGVLRPGDAFRASGNDGNPLFHGNLTSASRPILLNRPFQSVGELGHAFRDLPFKSLDFTSDQSADSGLLDLFSLEDEPMVSAGGININNAPAPVLSALLEGVTRDVYTSPLNSTAATEVATAIVANIAGSGPLMHRGDLANRLGTPINSALTEVADKANKSRSEAPMRALASVANMRTWNFLVDVVAQTGRLPSGSGDTTGAGFIVTGERRYWLHLAIDRYTGKVVDQQLELVSE